jgi:hypothetical protein
MKKANEDLLEEKTLVSKLTHFVKRPFAFILTLGSILGVEFLTLLNGWGISEKPFPNSQMMINNIAPKVNLTFKSTLPRIRIEIRPKIIYLNAIRFVLMTLDIP